MSQPFLDQHFGNHAFEPHNKSAVVDIHTHPPSTPLLTKPPCHKNRLFLETTPLTRAAQKKGPAGLEGGAKYFWVAERSEGRAPPHGHNRQHGSTVPVTAARKF